MTLNQTHYFTKLVQMIKIAKKEVEKKIVSHLDQDSNHDRSPIRSFQLLYNI